MLVFIVINYQNKQKKLLMIYVQITEASQNSFKSMLDFRPVHSHVESVLIRIPNL